MSNDHSAIPAYELFGENGSFPDIMHCERIADRASALNFKIPPHRHGLLHQFFHLEQPGARVTIDGKIIDVDRPCVLSIPRFHAHSFAFPADQRGHVLSVHPDTLPDLFGDDAERPDALSVWRMVPAEPPLAAAFERIRKELTGSAPLRSALLRAIVVEIAVGVLRGDALEAAMGPGSAGLHHMRRFERLVQETFGKRYSVAWYADRLGMSSEHLGRVTRTNAGVSPGRFVEKSLMREARRQLAYARTPVATIGYALGYDDPAYFSRVFRRHEGVSPTAYRRGVCDVS